jgi:hypothetical protein
MYKVLFILLLFAINHDFKKISYKKLRMRLIKHKAVEYGEKSMAHLTKEMGDDYFNSIMETVAKELECAGYTLLDKSFEGIIEAIAMLQADQRVNRIMVQGAEELIYAVLIALSIPIILVIMGLVAAAVYMRRFYVRTMIFMENTVKRVKEVKSVTFRTCEKS